MNHSKILVQISTWLYWGCLAFLVLAAIFLAVSTLPIPGSFRIYTIQSGSMQPTIPVGSLIISQPRSNYQPGDIITFKNPGDRTVQKPKVTITHRVVSVAEKDGSQLYTTKGDANDTPDLQAVNKDLVLGKEILALPLLGQPVAFAKTKLGFVALIIIPAVIIIYGEVLTIATEIKRLHKSKHGMASPDMTCVGPRYLAQERNKS